MTDKYAGLSKLANVADDKGEATALRDAALQDFYAFAGGNALVVNKWFSAQAVSKKPNVLEHVKSLEAHPDFTLSNPNRCRSLVSTFTGNLAAFHAEDGSGYEYIGVKAALERILAAEGLSPDTSEVVTRALK